MYSDPDAFRTIETAKRPGSRKLPGRFLNCRLPAAFHTPGGQQPADIGAAAQRQHQQCGYRKAKGPLDQIAGDSRRRGRQSQREVPSSGSRQNAVIEPIACCHDDLSRQAAHRRRPSPSAQRPVEQRRRQSHQRLDHQRSRHIHGIAGQQIRQSRSHSAGCRAIGRSQQIGPQQNHRVSQVQVSVGGGRDLDQHGGYAAQGHKHGRQHHLPGPAASLRPLRGK